MSRLGHLPHSRHGLKTDPVTLKDHSHVTVACVNSLPGMQHHRSDRLLVVGQSSSGLSGNQIPQPDC